MTGLSVIVPVRNGAAYLSRTLPALRAALPAAELIVSDDGSTDGSGEAARSLGARVVRAETPHGAAAARNRGAEAATGELLVFVDADVLASGPALERLLAAFQDEGVAAAFGSYDAEPAGSWVSRYKNLAHHFVHQRSNAEASTFWTGCGAIRRTVLRAMGGFDPTVRGIEDVELGYRLKENGHRIRLVHQAQVTHLKEWTLRSWLMSDAFDRARPWARLVRAGRGLPRDLNFRRADHLAVALTAASLAALVLAALVPVMLVPGALAFASTVAVDAPFLAFCRRRLGVGFAMAATLFQALHRLAGLVGFAAGCIGAALQRVSQESEHMPSTTEGAVPSLVEQSRPLLSPQNARTPVRPGDSGTAR